MKKLDISQLVCTIEQGKKLDELLGRVGQYSDNLFHHVVYKPHAKAKPHYDVVLAEMSKYLDPTIYPADEIVCNAYCDAELDQLLPSSIVINDATVFIGMCKTEDEQYQVYYRNPMSIMSTTPLETMKSSVQVKAQCLIWLIENTGYKPLNE